MGRPGRDDRFVSKQILRTIALSSAGIDRALSDLKLWPGKVIHFLSDFDWKSSRKSGV